MTVSYLKTFSALLICSVIISLNCVKHSTQSLPPCPLPTDPDTYFLTYDKGAEWSPDGRWIAYYSIFSDSTNRPGSFHIWIINPFGFDLRYVTPGFNPSWSPDGESLVFNGNDYNIYVISINGTGLRQLTNFPEEDLLPDWSPKGDKIAFQTEHNDPRRAFAIWVMNRDGTNKTDISIHGTGAWGYPEWSPDGKLIAHVRYVPEGTQMPEIFVMGPDGSNPTRLTNDQYYDVAPSWSPDGRKIAFSSTFRPDSKDQIWIMDSSGHNQFQLTRCGGIRPSWSPDGRYIVYSAQTDGGFLKIINIITRQESQLTFFSLYSLYSKK